MRLYNFDKSYYLALIKQLHLYNFGFYKFVVVLIQCQERELGFTNQFINIKF